MLRVSANATDSNVDINMINGEWKENTSDVEHGFELMKFAEALASGIEDDLIVARKEMLEIAGPAVLVDTAGVAANFQRMVRIADAMGIPVDTNKSELSNKVRTDLDLYRFASAENSS
jgi:hypothetical protein